MLHDIIDNPSTDDIGNVIDMIEDGVCDVFIDGEEITKDNIKDCFPSP